MLDNHPPSDASRRRTRRRFLLVLLIAGLVVALVAVALYLSAAAQPETDRQKLGAAPVSDSRAQATTSAVATPRPVPAEPAPVAPVETFNRATNSVDDPASLWVVVNKQRPLPDFVPAGLVDVPVAHTWEPRLRPEASAAVVALFEAAQTEAGLKLASNSAYRGFDAQTRVYTAAVNARGTASADTSIARPGSSEHQTGLAVDIGGKAGGCSLVACFADTAEGQWLAENAWRFGFLLRYPADKVAVTGYAFEPWHFRYLGQDLATEMHESGVSTLEEFFGLPAAPGYR